MCDNNKDAQPEDESEVKFIPKTFTSAPDGLPTVIPEQILPFPKAAPRKDGRARCKAREGPYSSCNSQEEGGKKPEPRKPSKKRTVVESDSDHELLATLIEEPDSDAEQKNNGSESRDEVIGKFVLVKFTTKTSCVHYVGEILEKVDVLEWKVHFYAKTAQGTFIKPERSDISVIEDRRMDGWMDLLQSLTKS